MMNHFAMSSVMFSVVPFIIGVGFVFVIGMIIVKAIQGGMEWNSNNNSPVLTVDAFVITKRTKIDSHHHHGNNMHGHGHTMGHSSSSTTYFATFQVDSGDRMEFKVSGAEYGMLAEGDVGRLMFQGTRYKGFERSRNEGD